GYGVTATDAGRKAPPYNSQIVAQLRGLRLDEFAEPRETGDRSSGQPLRNPVRFPGPCGGRAVEQWHGSDGVDHANTAPGSAAIADALAQRGDEVSPLVPVRLPHLHPRFGAAPDIDIHPRSPIIEDHAQHRGPFHIRPGATGENGTEQRST